MSARLAAGVEISALIRRIEHRGGTAMVLARGDATAGAILLELTDRGTVFGLLERSLGVDGVYRWARTGPQDVDNEQSLTDYIRRRRAIDGDLWVLELDIAGVERFAAELIAAG